MLEGGVSVLLLGLAASAAAFPLRLGPHDLHRLYVSRRLQVGTVLEDLRPVRCCHGPIARYGYYLNAS